MTFPALDIAAIRPDVDSVGLLLTTRTIDHSTGLEVGTFTETTRPTAPQVETIIDLALEAVAVQLPYTLDPLLNPAVMGIVSLKAAVMVETSFYRQTGPDTPADVLDKLADAQLAALSVRAGDGPIIF